MKLSLKIDLEPLRQKTLTQIDNHFGRQMSSPLDGIHALKVQYAHAILSQGETAAPAALIAEAATRGVPPATLAAQIVTKDSEQTNARFALETARLGMRAQVQNAATEQELKALLPK